MSTVVGGMIGFMARQFTIEFIRPVYSGDTITASMKITNLGELSTAERRGASSVSPGIRNPMHHLSGCELGGRLPPPFL